VTVGRFTVFDLSDDSDLGDHEDGKSESESMTVGRPTVVDDLETSDEEDGGALVPLRLNLAAGSRCSVTVDRFTVYDDSEESSDDPGFRGTCRNA
jgi:hypothetical protein